MGVWWPWARFKRLRQKCELLFEGPLRLRASGQNCSYLLLWTDGDFGLDLYSTWSLSTEQKKMLRRTRQDPRKQGTIFLNSLKLRRLKVYMTVFFLFARSNLPNVLISTAKKFFPWRFSFPVYWSTKSIKFHFRWGTKPRAQKQEMGTIVTSI